jgi:L-cysteine desulfidase
MKEIDEIFLNLLKEGITPATGCTEPIAVAYAVAKAREASLKGELMNIKIEVDSNLYKNGLMVTIPGTTEKGLLFAAAFGYLTGRTEKGFRVIEGLEENDILEAKKLLTANKIELTLNRDYQGIFIEVILTTKLEKIRVITKDKHLNVIKVEKISANERFAPLIFENGKKDKNNGIIQGYKLDDFLNFSNNIPLKRLSFLKDGIDMNLRIANEGLSINSGVAATYIKLIQDGLLSDNMLSRAQILCAAASEARMSGSKLPVMSTAGSGNHGITAFLTNYAVFEKNKLSLETLLRSLSLTNLITFFIKSYTGTLSAMCGCGVAAGIGASAGVVYQLAGNPSQIMGALYNMVGSISGMICDGAKEGCAYKLALASGWAVQCALFSLKADNY